MSDYSHIINKTLFSTQRILTEFSPVSKTRVSRKTDKVSYILSILQKLYLLFYEHSLRKIGL